MRAWNGSPLHLSFAGNVELARQYVQRARVYAGFLMDQLGGKDTTRFHQFNEPDGTRIWVQAWKDMQGERVIAQIHSPPSGGTTILPLPGIVAFIPAKGFLPLLIDDGTYLDVPRYVYASPYLDNNGGKLNGLLGTQAQVTVHGKEGDHRVAKTSEAAWMAVKDKTTLKWTASRAHAGYFGMQNWLGTRKDANENTLDVISWDGPRGRYANPFNHGYQVSSGQVYHRMRVLADVADEQLSYYVIGAGIHHADNTSWLYQICATSDLKFNVFKWQVQKTGGIDEHDEFSERYQVTGVKTLIATHDPNIDFQTEDNYALWEARTGFLFNTTGDKAVMTIATVRHTGGTPLNPCGTYRTYLYHFDIAAGFSRELVWDGSSGGEEEGEILYPYKVGLDWVQVARGVKTYPYGDYRFWYFLEDLQEHKTQVDTLNFVYKTKPKTQTLCADYVGDEIVYLYYTNPEVTVTVDLLSQWSADYWPSYVNEQGWVLSSWVTGNITDWNVSNNTKVSVSKRRFWSSNNSIFWEGGECETTIKMGGKEDNFLHGLVGDPPGHYDPQPEPNPTWPDEFSISTRHIWNGWAYDNPAECRAQRVDYNINFLDLRFGLMTLTEDAWAESADVTWRMNFGVDGVQYFDVERTKTFRIIAGTKEVDALEYQHDNGHLAIGIPFPEWGINSGSGFGFDYFDRLRDYYIPFPSDTEKVGTLMNQPWCATAKEWASVMSPKRPEIGAISMTYAGNDVIYTLPYGGVQYKPNGTNPDLATLGDIKQASLWGEDDNPQKTFFEGDVAKHFLANLALV